MPKTRVMVVDDSVVMRHLISSVLEDHPDIEVGGIAANGKIALSLIRQEKPDLITLDVEMPEMDGLTALAEIHKLHPHIPVIMFSTLTQRGAVQTIEALTRGATDYVAKPANVGSVQESIDRLRGELIPKILTFTRRSAEIGARPAQIQPLRRTSGRCEVVAIASSTGGPNALQVVLSELPEGFPAPLLLVQHMPPVFTGLLARRLNEICRIRVVEAEEGQPIKAGCAYIAPGGKHLEARSTKEGVVAHLHESAPENSCRPAADVLFRSVAQIWADRILCVVMTGMGQDGKLGAMAIRDKGGTVFAQDRETSVVWGMPGSVVEGNLADEVLPLQGIAPAIMARLQKGRVNAVSRR